MNNSILYLSAAVLILAVLYAADPQLGLGFTSLVLIGLLINRAQNFSLYRQEV